jgi:hypothetical protein
LELILEGRKGGGNNGGAEGAPQGGMVPERVDFLPQIARNVSEAGLQDRRDVFLAALRAAFFAAKPFDAGDVKHTLAFREPAIRNAGFIRQD